MDELEKNSLKKDLLFQQDQTICYKSKDSMDNRSNFWK